MAEIKIHLDGDIYSFHMRNEESILEAALDEGIEMPFSCQNGLCTSCRCRKISGDVEMESDDGLTDHEINEGYVLICVGKPASSFVELEVG